MTVATGFLDVVKAALPYVGIFGTIVLGVILPIVLWGKRVEGKLDLIKDNHLHTIQDNTAEANVHLIRIATILEERRGLPHEGE